MTSAAEAYVHGVSVDWTARHTRRTRLVDLPTYPFQRQRYWLDAGGGLASSDHPLLDAEIELAEGAGLVFTGRLSLTRQPWLADHAVAGRALMPGTGFTELALAAGERLGLPVLESLTLETPLPIPDGHAVRLQLVAGPRDDDGRRPVTVHSWNGHEWVRHAAGTLAPAGSPAERDDGDAWPPPGAEPVPLAGWYERLAERGYDYGPTFRGLRAVWRRGDEIYAEAVLPTPDTGGFLLHPALLDAALHCLAAVRDADGQVELPFGWHDVTVAAGGASAVRVRMTRDDDAYTVRLSDRSGAPVASIGALRLRPVPLDRIRALDGGRADALFRLAWDATPRPAAAPDPGVVYAVPAPALPVPEAVRAVAAEVLREVQRWLSEDGTRLVVLTEGAVIAADGDRPNLAHAPVWGMLRAAQAEHPDRFVLVDLDGRPESRAALAAAVATGEPQIAVRAGTVLLPRLVRAAATGPSAPIHHGTVLITGATGTLGRMLARHLADQGRARHLLLAGRRGADAPGAAELREELTRLGAEVSVAACDVADREALARLLADIPAEHPLTGVIHAAGVLDDGTVEALDGERFDRVLRPKADAAWHLHELTRECDLAEFTLFSSASGLLGGPGQANYAAANAFLDALAAHRHVLGLPATSLAWGHWAPASGMTGGLTDVDRARIARLGIGSLDAAEGLALYDAAAATGEALLVPIRPAGTASVPWLLRGTVAARRGRRGEGPSGEAFRRSIAGQPAAEREHLVQELVRAQVATVLNHRGPEAVSPDRPFQEVGFDSLIAVDLRNRLSAATGLRLPATLAFDHPTPRAVAGYLLTLLAGEEPSMPVLERIDRLRADLAALTATADDDVRSAVGDRLRALLRDWRGAAPTGGDLADVSAQELIELLDEELGQ